ncbi:TolB-like 6-blade propeller-like [Cyclobacterium lianum]|uniref:TolB-like 6-blade propeller-like n=1 Tax=Cyclobacterium lianum TaxID=388280 RepID=A0A1M7PX98_9BACT|nr:BF3164 family lipoprotein [Cyclobacterium lianum]SHN22335.1 TolB-like 6-blade propeller-like [Cyclobacterium lianum]
MNKFILVLFLFALGSCQKNPEEDNYRIIKEEDFEIISITSEKYYFEEIINPSNIGLVGRKVLISEAWRVPEEHPRIHIIDSKNWTYDKPKGKFGEGPLEVIDASLFFKGKNADTFWAYSMNRRKLVEYSMSDSTLLGKSEWKMTEPMMDLWFFTQATDSSYLGISREDKNRILEFDKAGNKIGGYGNWEKVKDQPDLNDYQLSELNSSFFKGNSDEGLFIRVGLRRDRLEIFDNRDKSFMIIDGPDMELPPFELVGADGKEHLYLGPDPRYHYRDAVVTEKYIFALYAGVRHSEFNKTAIMAEQIWVFDHKGKPRWKLMLDRSIINFVVNEESNEIYGLTTDEDPGIAVYNIPKELL